MSFLHLSVAVGLLLAGPAALANNCEAIRQQVEARIRASGVQSFAVTIVDASATTAGRVVGSCALGTRKLVYRQFAASAAAPSGPRPGPILTECKDGSTSYGGDCRK
jgi:hypothetical protein